MIVTAAGPAGTSEAWQRLTEFDQWTSWARHLRHVDCPESSVAPGAAGSVTTPFGRVDFEILERDDILKSWTWRVSRGGIGAVMTHSIVPLGDGRTLACLTSDGFGLLEPYRPFALLALRRLVQPLAGAEPPPTVDRFGFAFDPRYRVAAAPFGITPGNSWIDVGPHWLVAAYGPWRLVTQRDNVLETSLTRDFSFLKTAGPPHLSFADKGVSFTPNGDSGLCLRFRDRVHGIDPTGAIRHPSATLGAADVEGLADAVGV